MRSVEDMQLDRMLKFPRDRIAFMKSNNAVQEDLKNFKLWAKGYIDLKALCQATARVNHLPRVSEEQMINELKITGWLVDE